MVLEGESGSGAHQAPARVVLCVDTHPLQLKLEAVLASWPEFEVVTTTHTAADACKLAESGEVDLVVLEATLCRDGLGADVGMLVRAGAPVVVLTGRSAYPSVVEFEDRMAARAVQLPTWVLDREDDLTAAHTRCLLLDLCDKGATPRRTGEVQSPAVALSRRRKLS